MAIYYVRNSGDNGNNGLGYTGGAGAGDRAWATIAYAVSQVAAGDTVRIAPGTYYETITIATSGILGNLIIWWGDKEAQYFLDLKPGYVRVTGCDSGTGIGAASLLVNCNSKSYNSFYNFVFDGTATAGGGIAGNPYIIYFYNCIISAAGYAVYGPYGVANQLFMYSCVISGGYATGYYLNCYNCLLFGAQYGIVYQGYAENCVMIGSYIGFHSGIVAVNCSTIGSYIGYYDVIGTNCIAFGALYPFYNTTPGKFLKKCKAINSSNDSVCSVGDYDNRFSQVNAKNRATTESKYEGWTDISRLLKVATALKFDIFEQGWSSDLHEYTVAGATTPTTANNDYVTIGTYNGDSLYQSIYKDALIFSSTTLSSGNWVIQTNATTTPDEGSGGEDNYAYCATLVGTYTNVGNFAGTITCAVFTPIVFTENYDILRQPRRMGSGSTLDCGAFEYSNTELEWTTYRTFAPSIKISQAGYKTLTIPVKMNTSKTISCWTQFNLDDGGGGADTPQMIISASGVSENILSADIVVDATGDGTVWEQLTSTFTPIASGLLTINFRNRYQGDSNNSVAYFSDISL